MWQHLVHDYEGLLVVAALLLTLVAICALPSAVWLD
jgi:hypothetical protein